MMTSKKKIHKTLRRIYMKHPSLWNGMFHVLFKLKMISRKTVILVDAKTRDNLWVREKH